MNALRYALLLLLVLPILSANLGFPSTNSLNNSRVIIGQSDPNDPTINFSVVIYSQAVDTQTERDQIAKFEADCAAAGTPTQECFYDKATTYNNNVNEPVVSSLYPSGAVFDVFYRSANMQWVEVPNCQDLIANEPATASFYDSTGSWSTYTFYYADCDLSQLTGSPETAFMVRYIPASNSGIAGSWDTGVIRNPNATFSTAITTRLRQIFYGFNSPVSGNIIPCLGFFLLGGLLVSSLYFSGKSPVSLLDITTPRLPTPKGVVAGGQILAPFGYTEMKLTTKNKMTAASNALEAATKRMVASLGLDPTLTRLNARITAERGTMADRFAKDVDQQKKVSRALVAAGRTLGWGEGRLNPLTALPYHYGNTEHQTIAQLLQELERRGGRFAIMAMTLKDYLFGLRTFQSLETLTAMPDIGKRSAAHQFVTTYMVGKFVGANRYSVLGPVVASSVDSTFRTARIMGRMTVSGIKEAPALARNIVNTGLKGSIGLVVGRRGVEALEAKMTSGVGKALLGSIDKRSTTADIAVGAMFPINDKMSHLYRSLRDEIYRDEMRYVLREVYRHFGINFDMSKQELASMGHIDIDILHKAGYRRSAALDAIESDIRRELFAGVDPYTKLQAIIMVARTHGITIHAREINDINLRLSHIESIGPDHDFGHIKFIRIQEILDEQKTRLSTDGHNPLHRNDYFCHVGGDSLNSGARPDARHTWETMVLRTMIWDGEHGHLGGGIKEELLSARLNVVNRLTSLNPLSAVEHLPEYMRDLGQLQAVANRNRADLLELFTDEGRRMYQQYSHGRDINTASIADIVSFMHGGTMLRTKQVDPKTGRVVWHSGADEELGLPEKATLVDVKRHWQSTLSSKDNTAIGEWVESRFTRGYTAAYKESIEAELDRRGGAGWSVEQRRNEAKKEWVIHELMQDMEQRFNSHFAQNTYGTTAETSRFYFGVMLGFLERAMRTSPIPPTPAELAFVSGNSSIQPSQYGMLIQLLHKYHSEYAGVLRTPMTYDEVAKADKAVVMLNEGGFAYYKKGMALSDMDRVMAGQTCLADEKGQKRPFMPDDVVRDFETRADLKQQFNNLRNGVRDVNTWLAFIDEVNRWAQQGGYNYKRQQVLEAVIWEGRNATYDYMLGSEYSQLTIESKRNVMPLTPSQLRFIGFTETPNVNERVIAPMRDIGMYIGDYISRVALVSGGPVHTASYDITATSSAYRLHSMQLVSHIMADKDDRFARDLNDEERRAYHAFAISHSAFFQVWQFAIDRNPWRASTSFGTHQAWSSFFQFGPSVPYDIQDNLTAFMDSGTYRAFMWTYGFPMQAAKFFMRPYVNMLRGFQMSMQGYASKWDNTDDPLRQWNYTNPRILEALQTLNPFSAGMFGHAGVGGILSRSLSSLNVWQGSAERRQLAGTDFQRGLGQSFADIVLQRKGVYSSARLGDANPGEAFYDYRYNLQADATMAEYLYRTARIGNDQSRALNGIFGYDQATIDAGLNNTVRRTVSAEALAIRRRQELDMFGPERNSLWGFFNPLLFPYHVPIPFFPQQLTPRELATTAISYLKHGNTGGSGVIGSAIKFGRDMVTNTKSLARPDLRAFYVPCPRCGVVNPRGGNCKHCRYTIY